MQEIGTVMYGRIQSACFTGPKLKALVNVFGHARVPILLGKFARTALKATA